MNVMDWCLPLMAGVALGGVATWVVLTRLIRPTADTATLQRQLTDTERRLTEATTQLQQQRELNARLSAQTELLESTTSRQEAQAQQLMTRIATQEEELRAVTAQRASLQTALDQERAQHQTWRSELEKEWRDRFEALSNRTLNVVAEQLEKRAEKTFGDKHTLLNQEVKSLLEPLKKMVEENDQRVKALGDQTLKETATLKAQLELSFQQTQELIQAKNRIVNVLTDNKGRGDWGEFQLMRLLDMSGLVKDRDYEVQVTQAQDEDGRRRRPDVKVNLPNGHVLFIDAKTLVGSLAQLESATDETHTREERRKLAESLRKQVLDLSTRAYHTADDESVDFVVLFVPRESMLRVPLEEFPNLMEEAYQRGIILSSPLILMGLLKTVAHGWQQVTMQNSAREIYRAAKDLHKQAGLFFERFERLGDTIKKLSDQFEETRVAATGRQGVFMKIERLETLGARSERPLPDKLRELSAEANVLSLEDNLVALPT